MLHTRLFHRVTVNRAGHAISGMEKALSRTEVAANVPCLVQPVNAAETVTLLGQGAEITYEVTFDGASDIQARDELTWNEGSMTLEVLTVQKAYGRLGAQPRILKAICKEVRTS